MYNGDNRKLGKGREAKGPAILPSAISDWIFALTISFLRRTDLELLTQAQPGTLNLGTSKPPEIRCIVFWPYDDPGKFLTTVAFLRVSLESELFWRLSFASWLDCFLKHLLAGCEVAQWAHSSVPTIVCPFAGWLIIGETNSFTKKSLTGIFGNKIFLREHEVEPKPNVLLPPFCNWVDRQFLSKGIIVTVPGAPS